MFKQKSFIVGLIVLLLVLAFWLIRRHSTRYGASPGGVAAPGPTIPQPNPAPAVAPKPVRPTSTMPVAAHPVVSPVKTPPVPPPHPAPALPMPGLTAHLPSVELHQELIPKDITIARCYYQQEVVAPGATFGFNIDGSGFTSEFEKMIQVDPGAKDVQVQNLHLVTANQIHGDIVVGPSAKTAYVTPKILIKGLPVYRAAEPFGVVRPGEVLSVKVLEVDMDGRSENFLVVTNIDENMFSQFWVEPDRPGPEISPLHPVYPFGVEGTLKIGSASTGDYTLIVSIFSKEKFRWQNVRIVPPNLGKSGLATEIETLEPFRRPGDKVHFYLTGTGFTQEDADLPLAMVDNFDMGQAVFHYISRTHMGFEFVIPSSVSVGTYGVTVQGTKFETLVHDREAFSVVPPLWVADVSVIPPAKVGRKSALRISGRDFTSDFARDMRIVTDDPAVEVSSVTFVGSETLSAEMTAGPSVAAGDYWLHLSVNGSPVKPQYGSLIKIGGP